MHRSPAGRAVRSNIISSGQGDFSVERKQGGARAFAMVDAGRWICLPFKIYILKLKIALSEPMTPLKMERGRIHPIDRTCRRIVSATDRGKPSSPIALLTGFLAKRSLLPDAAALVCQRNQRGLRSIPFAVENGCSKSCNCKLLRDRFWANCGGTACLLLLHADALPVRS